MKRTADRRVRIYGTEYTPGSLLSKVFRRSAGNHLTFYRVEGGQVVIVPVLHDARGCAALLFSEQ
jgi:plasmid stabilization system protein ParE